jgi:exopolysaccharide biosynthesis protein
MWAKRVAAIAVLGVLASVAAPPGQALAAGSPRVKITTRTIATGLVYKKIQDPAGPWIIHVLTVDPTKAVTMDTVSAGNKMGNWARTSTMASNAGALAAINGDFSLWPGRPTHPFAMDGILKQSGIRSGASFGYRRDETKGYIMHEGVSVTAKNLATAKALPVVSWNTDKPATNQVVGYNSYGGSAEKPPTDACSVRLSMSSKLTWAKNQMGVYRDYKVETRVCQSASLPVKDGTVVLSSKLSGTGASWIKAMKPGQAIRLTWDIGMPGVMDVIGGTPLLVDAGKVVTDPTCTDWICRGKNPRTAVGLTSTNKVLMVVVDGRKSTSVGMSLNTLAKYMQSLGARYAMNLDGGGSATMWIKGMGVVNDPTDSSGERAVTNALVVLPGADKSEVAPLAGRRSIYSPSLLVSEDEAFEVPLLSRAERRAAMDASLMDPASTGGLMDYLVSMAGSRARAELPASFLRMARQFRSSR